MLTLISVASNITVVLGYNSLKKLALYYELLTGLASKSVNQGEGTKVNLGCEYSGYR